MTFIYCTIINIKFPGTSIANHSIISLKVQNDIYLDQNGFHV